MSEKKPISFLLVGVGGQGTILASNIIADLGLSLGYDVKKAEIHGMSQRGGSVTSSVRWADEVNSPIVTEGTADFFIAFEKAEAVRFINYVRPGGKILINDYVITPVTVSAGSAEYPSEETIHTTIEQYSDKAEWLNGIKIAEGLGNAKAANVVLLGALSKLLGLEAEPWIESIKRLVPAKHLELNLKAFEAGRNAI
jgi:indolepyruvate ferredoxin oxidoreductase beta subunit